MTPSIHAPSTGAVLPSAAPASARPSHYSLAVAQGAQRALARGWLWLALIALAVAGLFSVLLVVSRTPGLNRWLPVADFFRVALVVHVDLSVLVWFVAVAGLLWSLNGSARGAAWGWAALVLCSIGTALMSLAPFLAPAPAVMANYIPVLDGPLFIAALLVFGAGAAQ
jgi:cytochrome c oxidase subunit I